MKIACSKIACAAKIARGGRGRPSPAARLVENFEPCLNSGMDLNTVNEIVMPRTRRDLPAPQPGDAYLAGGTWLFSEPQPQVTRLVDLTGLGWPALQADETGLTIAATCTIAALAAFEAPSLWRAAPLIVQCCRALLGSFKIWNMATVGGNICMALPAGPMTALGTALQAECDIWTASGGARVMKVKDFVLGPQQTAIAPGDVLRAVRIPAAALRAQTAFRQISLSPLGRSGALLIGTLQDGAFGLTVTAATRRPVRLEFGGLPSAATLAARLGADIPDALYYDDVHGSPAWRRHMTYRFAEEIRAEFMA
jgi:CO/xanthine dehydrogenase FAD-binding subunit